MVAIAAGLSLPASITTVQASISAGFGVVVFRHAARSSDVLNRLRLRFLWLRAEAALDAVAGLLPRGAA